MNRVVVVLLSLCARVHFLQADDNSGSDSECGNQCPLKCTHYTQRPTSTYICDFSTIPAAVNNYCLRDDIAAYGEDQRLNLIANGCPGHPYFDHGILEQAYSRSGTPLSTSLNCTSTCESTIPTSVNPYIPRFQEYQFSLPSSPKMSSDGPLTLLQAFPSEADDYPFGIAINGILIVSEHYNETDSGQTLGAIETDYDNCGGHGDRTNRYHYHGPPVCLLLSMGATIPASGAQFLFENTSQLQVAHWELNGTPSPLVGYALDGFPIYGPYNASGNLQVAGSSDLDECLFNAKHQRYHMTANAPFSPPCLVGNLGDFSSKQVNEGICPVVDSAFCSGDTCQPHNQECEYRPCEFVMDTLWVMTLCLAIILLVALVCVKVLQCYRPAEWYYPFDKVIISVLPAVFFVVAHQSLFKAFFGLNKHDADNFDLDKEAIAANLNDGASAFLAITGILYTLIIAQIFVMTDEKCKNMRDALSDELSGCRQAVLCLQAISTNNDEEIKLKEKAIGVIVWYLGTVIKYWGCLDCDAEASRQTLKSLDLLFGSLSIVDTLCQRGTKHNFKVQVADRIIDSMNSISVAKYRRCALEEQHLPSLLWLLQYSIASSMFLGVLMIQSGSGELNLGMCYLVTALIGLNTLVIADMDMPYRGLIKLKIDSVLELFNYMDGVAHAESTTKINLSRQTSDFFKSKDARRKSLASLQHTITSQFKKRKVTASKRVKVDPSPEPSGTTVTTSATSTSHNTTCPTVEEGGAAEYGSCSCSREENVSGSSENVEDM